MTLASRLTRLETAVSCRTGCEGSKTVEQAWADFSTLHAWLNERGYMDCLDALKADESGPGGVGRTLAGAGCLRSETPGQGTH
jgi:hypothetical protein